MLHALSHSALQPLLSTAPHAGLRPQHLTGLQVVAALCGGQLLGGQVGSSCITLSPGQLVCSHHTGDTKTAGSCMLLAQSALPCLLFAATGQAGAPGAGSSAAAETAAAGAAEADAADDGAALQAAVRGGTASELDLRGGTDAAMAPPAGYMQHVLLPTLRRRLAVRASMQLIRRGFFPRGQGQVQLTVERLAPGACLPAIDLTERGEIMSIAIRAFTAGRVVPSVGERLADAALKGGWGSSGSEGEMKSWMACWALMLEGGLGQACASSCADLGGGPLLHLQLVTQPN